MRILQSCRSATGFLMTDTSSDEWIRVDYGDLYLPRSVAKTTTTLAPTIPISVRNPSAAAGSEVVVRARALMDTGAYMSAAPMWATEQLGIVLDEKSKQPTFSASGTFEAYRTKIGVVAAKLGRWSDIGVVKALVPDTEPSRDPTSRVPFLLGRDGFFTKYRACFDEVGKVTWLCRIDDNPTAAAIRWPALRPTTALGGSSRI